MNKMTVLIFVLALSGCANDPLSVYVADKIEADAAAAVARANAIGDQAGAQCAGSLGPVLMPPVGVIDFAEQFRGLQILAQGQCAPIVASVALAVIGKAIPIP